jgi:large subunit ribosomal protein L13
MKTLIPKPDQIQRSWYVVDATDLVLGRAAARIARVLRGKHKPQFTPHLDVGDFVIVVNAEKIQTTGDKESTKEYFSYSGYSGGAKWETVSHLRDRRPEELVRRAVRGMLPKNRLGRRLLTKLHVYVGPAHRHDAQKPQPLVLT